MNIQDIEIIYKENPKIEREDIKKLLEWIKEQPHLPQISEYEAIQFYHSREYSMEIAKRTIDINFTLKTHCPEFFADWNFQNKDLKKMMKTVGIFPLKNRTPEGYFVLWYKFNDYDASNYNFATSVKLLCMLFQMWLVESGAAPGYVFVMDTKGFNLGHITRIRPFIMKKALYYFQEAAPICIKGFHFINIVPHTDKLIALMKPFMKKELYDVLYLHPNMESFNSFLPKAIIPKDYGGTEDTSEKLTKNFYELAIKNQEYFTKEEKRHVDESLRQGEQQNASILFGVEGTFKKLDID